MSNRYVEKVRDALNDSSSQAMSKEAYVESLEEIVADIEGMLEAAREELEAADEADIEDTEDEGG